MNVTRGVGRETMIRQLSTQGIDSARVLQAMRTVPREHFVDEALRAKAYDDSSLPIGEKQTISQPWIVARMCELVDGGGGGRALEIGSGSGYHAAVLAGLFEQVYSVERVQSLSQRARQRLRALGIQNVHFKIFDGSYGWGEFAPYKAIVVTAAVPAIPQPLIDQLGDGGVLVAPQASPVGRDEQVLVTITKRGDEQTRDEHGSCRFVPLVGKYGMHP